MPSIENAFATEANSLGQKTPSLPVDPNLQTEQDEAQAGLTNALETQTQGDMASLMARYGTQLAISGAQASPLVSSRTGGLGAPSAARAA